MDPYKLVRSALAGVIDGFLEHEKAAAPPTLPGIDPALVTSLVDQRLGSLLANEPPPSAGELDGLLEGSPGWRQSSLLDDERLASQQQPYREQYRPDGDDETSSMPWQGPPS